MNRFPEKFRFFFVKDGVKTLCKHAPDEWDDNVIKWDRDRGNEGILVEYVETFTFVLEDADYLRKCFEEKKVFAKVRFIAEECNYNTFKYETYYEGDLDFYSYREDKYKIQVVVAEFGFKIILDANMDTEYEIEVPVGSDNVYYDRLALKNIILMRGKYEITADTHNKRRRYVPVFSMITDEVVVEKIETQYLSGEELNNDTWLFKVTKKQTIDINVSFYSNLISSGNNAIFLEMKHNEAVTQLETMTIEHFTFMSKRCDLEAGDLVYLSGIGIYIVGYVNVTISYYTQGDSSDSSEIKTVNIPGLRPVQLLKALVHKATDGKYDYVNYESIPSDLNSLIITSGNLIRGIGGSKITTSLGDFLKAMRAMMGVTHYFDNSEGHETLVMKHINDMFGQSRIVSLDKIKEYKKSIYNNKIYNQLKIGYKDNTYDELNGKYEFNTELNFSIQTDAKSQKLEFVSPYRADMYGIEFLLLNYEQRDSTDSDDDNDVFVFHTGKLNTNGGNLYDLNRDIRDNAGVSGGTNFNVYLSPKHCLLRQLEYIKSVFRFTGDTLKFASSPKSYAMESSDGVIEHADIDLTTGKILFEPILHEFETDVPTNISARIKANPNGYVGVDNNGEIIKGYIISVSQNPGRNKSQTWKLLELHDNK